MRSIDHHRLIKISQSSPEATNDGIMMVVMVMMVVVVVLMKGRFLINQAPDVTEFLHVAGESDGALVIEAVHLLGLLKKAHEEWVVEVNDRDYESLLLLSLLAHLYGQATLGHSPSSP